MMFHPRYWPTWLALGILRVFEPLPFPLLVWLGRRIGGLLARLPLGFVRIARRMLLCPPDLNPAHLDALIADAGIDAVVTDEPDRWVNSGVSLVAFLCVPEDRPAQAAAAR